jgi:GntR family transcriptional regulator
MIPFRVDFRPGVSVYEQVVYAAKKAVICRQMLPGDPFPSVRALSKELKINPNTAHKVVSQLVTNGLLETKPGVGTVVANLPEASLAERTELLEREIEQLVVEAKKLGIRFEQVVDAVYTQWELMGGFSRVDRGGRGRR